MAYPLLLSCSITQHNIERHAATSLGQIYEWGAIQTHLTDKCVDPNTLKSLETNSLLFISSAELSFLSEKDIRRLVQLFWLRWTRLRDAKFDSADALTPSIDVEAEVWENLHICNTAFPDLANKKIRNCLFDNCTFSSLDNTEFVECRFENSTRVSQLTGVVFRNCAYGDITDPFMFASCFQFTAKSDYLVQSGSKLYHSYYKSLTAATTVLLTSQQEFYKEKIKHALLIFTDQSPALELNARGIQSFARWASTLAPSYLGELISQHPPKRYLLSGDGHKVALAAAGLIGSGEWSSYLSELVKVLAQKTSLLPYLLGLALQKDMKDLSHCLCELVTERSEVRALTVFSIKLGTALSAEVSRLLVRKICAAE